MCMQRYIFYFKETRGIIFFRKNASTLRDENAKEHLLYRNRDGKIFHPLFDE